MKSPKLRGEEESGEDESDLNLKKPTPGISTLPKAMLPSAKLPGVTRQIGFCQTGRAKVTIPSLDQWLATIENH